MDNFTIKAISPVDGRYFEKTHELEPFFSEFGLMHARVIVELKWLEFLLIYVLKNNQVKLLRKNVLLLAKIHREFSLHDALKIKEIERITNHDLKAVEYFLKQKISKIPKLQKVVEYIHFACTSEDINNLAYALIIRSAMAQSLVPILLNLLTPLKELTKKYSKEPMLSRTHGQPASPTTFGKEIANFVVRIENQITQILETQIMGKFNGAVGNYNAHNFAYPEIDWLKVSKQFVESLGLDWNKYTTQIEPHDWMTELFHNFAHLNTILLDFVRDMWNYIAIGYLQQKIYKDEVGSSVMPHKVNPIDFENAEGNLGIANAMFYHFAQKLPVSRWQRDLSDSTVLRNIGVAFAHSLLAYKSILAGLTKISINPKRLNEDLEQNWEVLAEVVQTVMRKHNIVESYEKLKKLTRGKTITKQELHKFIEKSTLPKDVKKHLKTLTPQTYLGLAPKLAIDLK